MTCMLTTRPEATGADTPPIDRRAGLGGIFEPERAARITEVPSGTGFLAVDGNPVTKLEQLFRAGCANPVKQSD